MTTINQSMGLRPRTRARAATKSRRLDPRKICPGCGAGGVLKTQSRNGQRQGSHWCGQCSAFFTPTVNVNEEEVRAMDEKNHEGAVEHERATDEGMPPVDGPDGATGEPPAETPKDASAE